MGFQYRVWVIAVVVGVMASMSSVAVGQEQQERGDKHEGSGVVSETGDTLWRLSGRIRPRIETRFNHHFGLGDGEIGRSNHPDEAGLITQQSRLNIGFEHDSLSGRLTLQHTAQWGAFGGASLTIPPIGVYEARLRHEATESVAVDVGRFELAYGDEKVLGSVGWSQVGRTWDGLRVDMRPGESWDIDAFVTRHNAGGVSVGQGDAYLAGVYSTVEEPFGAVVSAADLYLLYDLQFGAEATDEDGVPSAEGQQLWMLGTRWAARWAGLDVTVEGAFQTGTYCPGPSVGLSCEVDAGEIRGYFADGEMGYEVAGLRPFVGGSYASGDDPDTAEIREAYQPMYPTGHAVLGFMDIIGPRTNLIELRGGLEASFAMFNAVLAAHGFRQVEPSGGLGAEFNLKVFADVTDSIQIGGGHGVYVPGSALSATDNVPEGVANWSFVQTVGRF